MHPITPLEWLTPQLIVSVIAATLALAGALGAWHIDRRAGADARPLGWFSGPRLVALPLLAWFVGAGSRMVRPYASWGSLHLEALGALVLLVTGTIALLATHARHATRAHHRIFQLELATIWAAFATGWSLVEGRAWGDLIAISTGWWLGSALVGATTFAIVRWRRNVSA